MKTTMTDREMLFKLAVVATDQLINKHYKESVKYSPEDLELLSLVQLTGYSRQLHRICEIILQRELPSLDSITIDFTSFCVIVPLSNPNGHNYALGLPFLQSFLYKDTFIRQDGSTGNHMTNLPMALRPATQGEIKILIDNLPESTINQLKDIIHTAS